MMMMLVLGRVCGTFGLRGGLLVLGGLLLGLRPGLDLFHLLALRTRSQDLAHLEVRVAQGLKGEGRRGNTDGRHCEFSDCDVFSHAEDDV